MLWDTAAALDEAAAAARDRTMSRPIYAPGALARMWAEAGLIEIDQRSLMIRMDFVDFADYWEPFAKRRRGARRLCLHPRRRPARTASSGICARPI